MRTAIVAFLLIGASSAGATSTFVPLPLGTQAWGVSRDGSTVVGRGPTVHAFRWTQPSGLEDLGDLPGGGNSSMAQAASGDGSIVVGQSSSQASQAGGGDAAFRWTQPSGMTAIGGLPGSLSTSRAWDISADGTVIVGNTGLGYATSGSEAFRWTSSGGGVGLGDLAGGGFASEATGVSADGSVVVGVGRSEILGFSSYEAFRWTQALGMVGLGLIQGGKCGALGSRATGVSGDGLVIVGQSCSPQGHEAFRWTEAGGMVGLGNLFSGQIGSRADAASGDGSVVVGFGTWSDKAAAAFIWREDVGMRPLSGVLGATGVDMTGWRLGEATDVSDDGHVVVGWGTDPEGHLRGFLAVVPDIVPEPSSFTLLAAGLATLAGGRRRMARRTPGHSAGW